MIKVVRKLCDPDWKMLTHPDGGQHLFLGRWPLALPKPWEDVDIEPPADHVVDLRSTTWPWKNVTTIHCSGMLYQFPLETSIQILRNIYKVLKPGGWLWASECLRDISNGRSSSYTPEGYRMLLYNIGFTATRMVDEQRVTGKIYNPALPTNFALHAIRPRHGL